MKKQLKSFMVLSMAGVLALGASITSFAQSDGIINYSDTFTKGEDVGAYIEGEYCGNTVNIFNNKNFTFSIDTDGLAQTTFKDLNNPNYRIYKSVWIGCLNENGLLDPLTINPYWEMDVDVKEVSDGIYSLEGLDIRDNAVYAIVASVSGDLQPTASKNIANAGGGAFSGFEPSYFKVVSAAADTTNTSTSDSGSSQENGIYYSWEQDSKGYWVQCSDGSYLTSQWYLSPASGLYYYLGADGYMLTNTVTPDGYTVDANGVWVQ